MNLPLAIKTAKFDAETILKNVLFITLVASYVILTFSIVVAIVVLPFEDPRVSFSGPETLLPLLGKFFLLDAFLGIIFGPGLGISLIAIFVVLLTTPRVARWLRVGVNDLIDGQHDDAFAIISQVNPHISGTNLPHTILPTIAATIAQTLKLPYVELEAQYSDGMLASAVGALPKGAEIERIPLLYQETKIGEMRVSARRSNELLSQSDLTVLRDLARQVGIALYAAQLTNDLQRARTRLVTAREEERRRIRRDLHDGLGPTLANIAMQLEQAREQLPPDAEESAAILAKLTTQAQTTITDVRRLVYDLRPPDLDEFGFVSALREYLNRRQTRQTVLHLVEPQTLPPLPAAVEVAAYRILQEAVNNALKHAHAGEINVTIKVVQRDDQPRALCLEIADSGSGIPDAHPVGIGLHSMVERAEELGGSCIVTGDAQGTRVVAYLPIEEQE